MESESKTHIHPISGEEIKGFRLEAGDTIQPGDMYDSTTGHWSALNSAFGGFKIRDNPGAICIRPE